MMLQYYEKAFANLKTDRASWKKSKDTNYRAPHKPFLLLSLMDLISQGEISSNFIALNAELIDTFDLYWLKVMGANTDGNIAMPFYHMKSEGFWHLIAIPGKEHALVAPIRSLRKMREYVLGVKLDAELYALMTDPQARDSLRRVLIETYFAPEIREKLVRIGIITAQSFEYSRELLNRAHGRFSLKEAPAMEVEYYTESRSTGFRRAVIAAYQHTCAMCKLRIVTPEGRTAVVGAHIVPWSISHNDDPRNGMALCGLHHWAFDEGLIGVDPQAYRMIVSPVVAQEEERTAVLRALDGQELFLPESPALHPAATALRWHRREVFRKQVPQYLL